jgi:hypothetical protein
MGKTKKFRSPTGCVICLTKSSSSRFTNSERFAEHFVACFGQRARGRSGDLCNACVLHVKRHMQRPIVRRQMAGFEKVLDSKKGAGPKHMKQIAKRQRSKDARFVSVPITATSNHSSSHQGQESSSNSSGMNVSFPLTRVDTRSKTQIQYQTVNITETSYHNSICRNGVNSTDSDLCVRTSYVSRNLPCYPVENVEHVENSSTASMDDRSTPLVTEFRVPKSELPGRNRYRRNFTTPPVKMSSESEEMDALLRSILAKNSQAVNLDAREMHTYLYKQRLRNHSAATTNVNSLCASSETLSHADYQSIGSASLCSGDLSSYKT